MKLCRDCKKFDKCGKPFGSNSNYAERCIHFEKKKLTNYERIKNMSIEEMAEFIYLNGDCCVYCEYFGKDHSVGFDCRVGIQKWLESEVEECG